MGKYLRVSGVEGNITRFYEQSTTPTIAQGLTLNDCWVDTSGIPTLRLCSNISPVTFILVGGGGTIAAPSTAKFWVRELDGTLSNEQVFTPGNYAEAIPIVVTGSSQQLAVNKTYVIDSSSLCTITLPVAPIFGDFILIRNVGVGGFKIAQNSGQIIHFGVINTTTGVSGYIQTVSQYDSIDLLCTTSTTDFMVSGCIGNITVT